MAKSVILALWKDIQQKAYRLLTSNNVTIDAISTYSILCTVVGDNDTYQTYVNNDSRVHKDNSISKANWYCTCPWGEWSNTGRRPHDGPDSYGTVKSNNRFCSHAYAAYLMLMQYRKLSKEKNEELKQQQEDQNIDQELDDQNIEDQSLDQELDSQDDADQNSLDDIDDFGAYDYDEDEDYDEDDDASETLI